MTRDQARGRIGPDSLEGEEEQLRRPVFQTGLSEPLGLKTELRKHGVVFTRPLTLARYLWLLPRTLRGAVRRGVKFNKLRLLDRQ
jgi:hypothetical protein